MSPPESGPRTTAGRLVRALVVAAVASAVLAPGCDAKPKRDPIDLTLLRKATHHARADMAAATPSGIAVLAWAWSIADRPGKARPLLRYLNALGTGAFGIRQPWTPFQPVNTTEYPADAIYTAVLVPVAQSYFIAHRRQALELAKSVLSDRIAFVNGCFAYDDQRSDLGCVHNTNASVLSLLSWLKGSYRDLMQPRFDAALSYEQQTIHPDGSWTYWEQAPNPAPNDFTHQAITAWVYLIAKNKRLRRLGKRALGPIRANWAPDRDRLAPADQASAYGPLAALVAGGSRSACSHVSEIPKWEYRWANPDRGEDPVAASFHVWSQLQCNKLGYRT